MDTNQGKFIVYVLGIFFCYFYYGIMQEKVTRGRYGTQENEDGTVGERFTLSLALVGVQCFCNYIFIKALLLANPQKHKDETPGSYYASCSLTFLLAMISSNMALQWVPYPTQVVGKSAKPIPVMILGVLIGRKTYGLQRYLCVLLIVIGVILFMFVDSKAAKSPTNNDRATIGQILLFLSLAMDGLTGAIQDRMRALSAPSGKQMMLAMNWWSSVILLVALVVTGEGLEFIAFSSRHPELIGHLAALALGGAIGQLFIFLMVSGFGPLACSVVTTTRKFFTVLFSVVFFGNTLIFRQWIGAVLVFTGLFADMILSKKKADAAAASKPEINLKLIKS